MNKGMKPQLWSDCATHLLCDLRKVPWCLWVSIIKWECCTRLKRSKVTLWVTVESNKKWLKDAHSGAQGEARRRWQMCRPERNESPRLIRRQQISITSCLRWQTAARDPCLLQTTELYALLLKLLSVSLCLSSSHSHTHKTLFCHHPASLPTGFTRLCGDNKCLRF